jgi:hypothetical protein
VENDRLEGLGLPPLSAAEGVAYVRAEAGFDDAGARERAVDDAWQADAETAAIVRQAAAVAVRARGFIESEARQGRVVEATAAVAHVTRATATQTSSVRGPVPDPVPLAAPRPTFIEKAQTLAAASGMTFDAAAAELLRGGPKPRAETATAPAPGTRRSVSVRANGRRSFSAGPALKAELDESFRQTGIEETARLEALQEDARHAEGV